jgi:tight adherence protein B
MGLLNISPIYVFVVVGIIALILLVVGIVVSATDERNLVEERLGQYIDRKQIEDQKKTMKAAPVTDWLNRKVEKSTFGDQIAKDLARADLKMKPGEYIGAQIILAVGVGAIAWWIGGRFLLLGIVGAVVGAFLPRIYVKRQQSQRLIKFNDQLSDMLNLMVNGLRAGYSTAQAMEAVSKELPAPICDEFRRVVQEMQLGVPMDTALDNLLRRIPSDDLDLVITAINVQREVGGNLAEILDTISFTIRERVRIKGEIRVLTSQVMYSGRFLSLLPIFVVLVLYLVNRPYMMEFFIETNQPCGYIALALAALLIILGYFVMNKLGEIEV